MPDFWQFPTVSMGLGPLMAIYQARFMKYLHDRGLAKTEGRKVWAFWATARWTSRSRRARFGTARENVDNRCSSSMQPAAPRRPVRGNGNIIEEPSRTSAVRLERYQGHLGPALGSALRRDRKGVLMRRMMEVVDGEYETIKSKDGGYVREYFFNTPELKELVADYSDEDIWKLTAVVMTRSRSKRVPRGHGHWGQPTVILVKTIKG